MSIPASAIRLETTTPSSAPATLAGDTTSGDAGPRRSRRVRKLTEKAEMANAMAKSKANGLKRSSADLDNQPKAKKVKTDMAVREKAVDTEDETAAPAKKARTVKAKAPAKAKAPTTKAATKTAVPKIAAPKTATVPKGARFPKIINNKPSAGKLDVYVWGEGSAGELGLGTVRAGPNGTAPVIDVKRPRLNPNLDAETVGVIQVAVGGMHCAVLTHDNRIITWGVNDQGALGRDTSHGKFEATPKENLEIYTDASGVERYKLYPFENMGLNSLECNPAEVDTSGVAAGTQWVQVVASDSATFALTNTGLVYGWGTFRANEGVLGFSPKVEIQRIPTLVDGLKSINSLTAGANHIVATQRTRNKSDEVTEKFYTWGSGQQSQLGRRILERRNLSSLIPTCFSIKYGSKVESKMASSGAYHTFILDGSDRVWSWGLNAQGETGIPQGVGEDNANINFPTVVESLDGYKIKDIAAGAHHSLACTEDGKLLFWGRCDGGQAGQDLDDIPKENLIFNDSGKPAIVAIPTVIPGIHAVSVGSGSDTCYAIDKDGCLWSWGFNANLQCGNGETDDVEEAEKVENTALKGKRLTGARGGGQFAVAFGVHTDE